MNSAGDWSSRALGYTFSDPSLLEQALTHKSRSAINNERLEFLGDAVLDMVIAEHLYRVETDANEDVMTRLRIRLVRGDTLNKLAEELGFDGKLRLGRGQTRVRSMLADALEAYYGAVYLDGGYTAVRTLILRHFASRLQNLPDYDDLKDPKSRLQEELARDGRQPPRYELLAESGPDHAPMFTVRCRVDDLDLSAEADGSSRQKAEQRAAKQLLRELEARNAP